VSVYITGFFTFYFENTTQKMKLLAIVFAIAAVASAITTPINVQAFAERQRIIEEVNASGTTWSAGHNKFSGKTTEELKAVCTLFTDRDDEILTLEPQFGFGADPVSACTHIGRAFSPSTPPPWNVTQSTFWYLFMQLCGTNLDQKPQLPLAAAKIVGDIPDSFDARTEWSQCSSIGNILDQGQCGSTYRSQFWMYMYLSPGEGGS
jgi:hypothetical protein